MRRTNALLLLLLTLVFLLVASSSVYAAKKDYDDDEYEDWFEQWGEQEIDLSTTKLVLYLDGDKSEREYQLEAEGNPNEEDIEWKSSDEKVALVSKNGMVKARKVGTCTITATGVESEKSATCTVEVKEDIVPVTEIKVRNDGEISVVKGTTEKLPYSLVPSNHTTVKIFSDVADKDVCSVDSSGNVRGIAAGQTTVTIWFSNEEKGQDSITKIDEDEAEFKAMFDVTVIERDVERLNHFNEEFEGFTILSRTDEAEYIWLEVKDVGFILYDAEESKYPNGWVSIGKNRYYLKQGEYEGKDENNNTVKHRFNVRQSGWVQEGNKWYLLGQDGKMMRGWSRTGGKWYYLDELTGEMKTGDLQLGNKKYKLLADGSAVERWYTDENGRLWYGNPQTCELPNGWFLVDGYWYYSDPITLEIVQSDWVTDESGNYYYLKENGQLLVSGITPEGYVVDEEGKWIQ